MRIEVRAVVEVPDNTPMEAIEEWVQYELGAGGMDQTTPWLNTVCIASAWMCRRHKLRHTVTAMNTRPN